MSYVSSLKKMRSVADRILSGEYQQDVKKASAEQQEGIVSRRRKSEKPEERQPESPEETMLSYMLYLKQNKEAVSRANAEGIDTRTVSTENVTRPTSRGDVATDAGRRLLTDLMNDFGLTREQAAGFVGNLDHETGGFKFMQEIEPVVPGSRGGYGFAQWTGPRRKQFEAWASENQKDLGSYEANYGFLKHELENTPEGRVLDSLRSAQTVEDAATVVSKKFLRPGIPHLDSRIARASRYLEEEV